MMSTSENVIADIKEYFSYQPQLIEVLWAKKNHLIQEFIPANFEGDRNDTPIWLNIREGGIEWSQTYSLNLVKDTVGKEIYEFECDVTIHGQIGMWHSTYQKEVIIPLNLKIYKYPDTHLIHKDHINIWSKEQKILNDYNNLIQRQSDNLGFENLENIEASNFSALTTTWDYIDNNNSKQVLAGSYYYFLELRNAFDHLKYIVANVNLYKQYCSNYLEEERPTDSGSFYKMNLNVYDKRYLDYCSVGFEKLYTFWERIAFLIHQFIKPNPQKLNENNLSFYKFMSELKKDINNGLYPELPLKECFTWFSDFEQKQHTSIQNYRHPLVHYNSRNNLYRGSFFAATQAYWSNNVTDKLKLTELQLENEKLCPFLTSQLQYCSVGLEKAIELIKAAKSTTS